MFLSDQRCGSNFFFIIIHIIRTLQIFKIAFTDTHYNRRISVGVYTYMYSNFVYTERKITPYTFTYLSRLFFEQFTLDPQT